jgi:polyribonucleotide nucleotidyltransferase
MKRYETELTIGDNKLKLQFGKLAQSSTMSVLCSMGDTCVLVTVVVGDENHGFDYFPLSVDYVEKLYAGGRIKGSRWVKREGKSSEEAVLVGRLIDRSIRPLFPKGFKKQVQIIATLLSVDGDHSPDMVSALGVYAALHVSSIPWNGPVSSIRVGYVKNNGTDEGIFVINPDDEEQKYSLIDLVVTSTEKKVVMIECKSEIVDDSIVHKAIEKAHDENIKITEQFNKIRKEIGKDKEQGHETDNEEEIKKIIQKEFKKEFDALLILQDKKADMKYAMFDLAEKIRESSSNTYEKKTIVGVLTGLQFAYIRKNILEHGKRVDGRKVDELREIYAEISILPRTHGSAIFQRGDTQVLSVATLGAPTLEQLIEGPEGEEVKRYIHHYYMPPYSVGEVGRIGFPSRREIGHGALAEKAIESVLPTQTDFPYAVRVVSEVLSSNGSTSMASTCGSSLALMDAGVPITSAVAGISIGLVSKSDTEYVLLTDIAGIEDFSGDMDFKIAGTKDGITAIQLDVKNDGLTIKMISESFAKARVALEKILKVMNDAISKPRKELSKYAPKVVVLTPPPDKVGEIIGPGGKNIKSIIAKTNTQIDISDDGKVSITGVDKEGVDKAVTLINSVYRKVNVGELFEGEVKRIVPFGAFIEYLPGKEGLVHVSRMGKGFIKDPHEVVSLGQKVSVRVSQIDHMGRVNLEITAN